MYDVLEEVEQLRYGRSVNIRGQWSCTYVYISIEIVQSGLMSSYLRENCGKDFNVLALFRGDMLPIHEHTRLPNHGN